jgi:multiple sugar transport system permease protein
MVPARAKTIAFDALQGAFILLVMMLVVFPVLWTVLTSFKERVAIFSIPPVWFFKPTIRNYVDAFTLKPVLRALINSSIIAVLTTIISVAAGSMGAYAAARFRFRGSREIPIIVLFGRMIPSITFVVPYFILIRKLGLLDTRLGVILSHIGFNLPFALLLLRSFFASIPRDLEQAAIIDGCTLWGGFWRIALPLAAPGIATTMIFCLLYSWNEFLFALILTSTRSQTLPIIAASFITPIGIEWGQIFSMVVITMAPMVVLGVLIRNHFVKGLTMGALKG